MFLNGFINNQMVGPKGACSRAFGAAVGCFIVVQFTFALTYDVFTVAHSPASTFPSSARLQGSRPCRSTLPSWTAFHARAGLVRLSTSWKGSTGNGMTGFSGYRHRPPIGWMVTRVRGDKEHLPPPVPATPADVPAPFQQVQREVTGVMEEMREFARRQTVDINSIAECVRTMRDEAKQYTSLLAAIEREQATENRTHGHDAHAKRAPPSQLVRRATAPVCRPQSTI